MWDVIENSARESFRRLLVVSPPSDLSERSNHLDGDGDMALRLSLD